VDAGQSASSRRWPGIRRVTSLALPAFVASAASTLSLQADILADCAALDSNFLHVVRSRIMCLTSPALSLYCYRIVASLSPYCLGVIECVRAVSRDFIIYA